MITEQVTRRRRILREAGLPSPIRSALEASPSIAPIPPRRPCPTASDGLALIATRNFLPFAKLAAQTFLAHHAEFRAFLLLVDGGPQDVMAFPEGHVIFLSDLGLDHAGWYAAKFTASELSNALKPAFLKYLAGFVTNAIYMDCDIAVFSRLNEMVGLLESRDLVLVPHMLRPLPRPEQFWTHPTRADIFNSGLINAGCFGIRLAQCRDFLTFWEEANFAPGAFYQGAGYQTDQQHLNWALVTVPGACMLRESRYNVAYWSLHDRDLRLKTDENDKLQFEVDNKPLGFFHFSGFDINDSLQLSRHDQRHSVYNLPAVAELLGWYSREILACSTAPMLQEPYRFDRLANGFQLNRFVRELLKKYERYVPKFDCLTQIGADGLCAFLMDPLPATGSMLPLIAAEIYEARPDLQHAYPGAHTEASSGFWRWFCRHAGPEHEIQFLVDRFRRVLLSDPVCGLAEQASARLTTDQLQFLGSNRVSAAQRLRMLGENGLADTLLEARTELRFSTDLSAAFEIYLHRPDLQQAFPDILDRDHKAFCEWLTRHAPEEHDCPPAVGETFRRRSVGVCLARLFSYLCRREDVARTCQVCLLSDDPERILRDLIRGAGEGLEYDLDDVVVLQFVHRTKRQLLVPLYLELPLVRQHAQASRIAEMSVLLLPENLRNAEWAREGCKIHAACFERFEAFLDEEMRRWGTTFSSPSRDVFGFLRSPRPDERAIGVIGPAYRASVRRLLGCDEAVSRDLWLHLKARECKPGVNIFGYFYSDIGVGESTRGLAQAVSLLRPVNRVPFCTSQLQDRIILSDLFQRFDYLSDTNLFVSYPHLHTDLLGMMRPEYLMGRRNIVHLAWEQKDANPLWKAVYDRYDEIWTISEFAAIPFRKMFPGRVRVVPNVVDFHNFPSWEELNQSRLTGELLKFLFVFDANSSMERKNPEAVIEAFVRALKGTRHAKRASLTLKIAGMHRQEHAGRIERLMSKARESGLAINFDGRQLGREAMLRLIAEADCYVSLHRAEGFGYTMAEAMFYGVPVIASGYSGNLEYMTSGNSFLVPCKEMFVKNADGPFQRGSIWGEPDIEVAATLIRQIADKPTDALNLGQRGREAVIAKLSAAAVAESITSCFVTTTVEEQKIAAE